MSYYLEGQLNLVLLQPKQRNRAQEGEATITRVLQVLRYEVIILQYLNMNQIQDRLQGATEKEVMDLEKFFKVNCPDSNLNFQLNFRLLGQKGTQFEESPFKG